MGKRIAATVCRARARRGAAVLGLLACLLIAGCAQHDRGSDEENRSGGFYGGVFGGPGM
jgi:hypothetical protein